MSQKEEKPQLAGVRIRTRKRNIVVPHDPQSFADALIDIIEDGRDGLDEADRSNVTKILDAANKARRISSCLSVTLNSTPAAAAQSEAAAPLPLLHTRCSTDLLLAASISCCRHHPTDEQCSLQPLHNADAGCGGCGGPRLFALRRHAV
jgi:hypothetical protein